ncbi:hypothetical protein GP486_002247 [Trichoglossum hirsutum]|uniref:Uncharacterized protein n=1 Tax=Trichoglossum hirsutum TaxID=265104 RepID=A0A9P8LF47_9PEZI|nr:hypothetical protein GP486_002247 [Trichoglossum hirsutum]
MKLNFSYTFEAKLSMGTGQNKIGFHKALKRIHMRRKAFALAKPVSVSLLGYAATFLYQQGVLCYRVDEPMTRIRVRDIHNSSAVESVIDVVKLISHTVKGVRCRAGTCRLLNYADGILVCLLEAHWLQPRLLAVNVNTGHCLATLELETSQRIFVRNNSDYLLYGTHSSVGSHGHHEWVISGYNMKKKRHIKGIRLSNLVGYDIGSTVAFEIHRGYFYAVSNQTSFEVKEVDWTSFYRGYRFPLENACEGNLEAEQWWRRNHVEGPINDSWTDLKLHVDECTGDLMIVEARKEWPGGGSNGQRTCYTRVVQFPNKENPEDSLMLDRKSNLEGGPYPTLSGERPAFLFTQRIRHPKNVHHDDSGTANEFIIARTMVRYYSPDANAFLDLVNDPEDPLRNGDFRPRQRLRLRVSSRIVCPPNSSEPYRPRGILMWPPNRTSKGDDELTKLPNPLSGKAEGKCDERSLIYTIGDTERRAMVLVNFDEGIDLCSKHHNRNFHAQNRISKAAANTYRTHGGGLAPHRVRPCERIGGGSLAIDHVRPCKRTRTSIHRSVPPMLLTPPGVEVPYFHQEEATYLSHKNVVI